MRVKLVALAPAVLLLAAAAVVVATRLGRHAPAEAPEAATIGPAAGAAAAGAPASPTNAATAEGSPPAPAAPPAEARAALQEMGRMAAQSNALKPVVPSSPERRAGEPDSFFQERQRAIAEYEQFLQHAQVPPDRDQALRHLIVDAEDNWQLALTAAGKAQPLAQGGEMADPVLQQVFMTTEQEFRQAAAKALTPTQAAIFQSEMPNVLPFVRTRAFEIH